MIETGIKRKCEDGKHLPKAKRLRVLKYNLALTSLLTRMKLATKP